MRVEISQKNQELILLIFYKKNKPHPSNISRLENPTNICYNRRN